VTRILGRLTRATRADCSLAAETLALAAAFEAVRYVVPLSRILQHVERRPVAAGRLSPADARRLVRASELAYRIIPLPATCLRRSLVLYALLRRRSAPAALRFGVRRIPERQRQRLEAHAWVECEGMDLEPAGTGFLPLEPARVP
jgi:transglutaminase superfamily protein